MIASSVEHNEQNLKHNKRACTLKANISQQETAVKRHTDNRKSDLIREYKLSKHDFDAKHKAEIRTKMHWLNQKLLLIEQAAQANVEKLDNCSERELKKQDFTETWSKCREVRYSSGICVESFFSDCYSCERDYAVKTEKLIKKYYGKLRKIVCDFPTEMFERDIVKINAEFLNNMRTYSKISVLVTQQQLYKLLKLKLWLASKLESWILVKQREAFEAKENESRRKAAEEENGMLYGSKQITQNCIQKLKQKNFLGFLSELGASDSENAWVILFDDTSEEWINELQNGEIDFALELVIKTFRLAKEKTRTALKLLVESFDITVEHNGESSIKYNGESSMITDENMYDYEKTDCKSTASSDFIQNSLTGWHNITCKILLKIKKSCNFLADITNIWNEHLQRLKETKYLIAVALSKHVEHQAEKRKSIQSGILMAMANIRLETNERSMSQQLQKISQFIHQTEESCRQELGEEMNILEKFREFSIVECQLLGAELAKLQEKYDFEQPITYFSLTQTDILPEEHQTQLPKHLQLCEFHTCAMENWNAAVMREIQTYYHICDKDVSSRMEGWMVEESYGLMDRFDGYIHMQGKQYERIEEQVYNKRLTELRNHQMLLYYHKNAVQSFLAQIPEDLEHFVSIFSDKIEISKTKLTEIELKSEAESSNYVEKLLSEVNNLQEKDESIFQNAFIHFKEQSNRKFEYTKQCQLNFMKSLKMFSEGGTYSSEEIQTVLSELGNIDKTITSKENSFDSELSKYYSVITDSMKECFVDVSRHLMSKLIEIHFSEDVISFLAEVEELVKNVFNEFQQGGMETTHECTNIILKLFNELQPLPSLPLLEEIDCFLAKVKERALKLLLTLNKQSVTSISSRASHISHAIKKKSSIPKITVGKAKLNDYRKLFSDYPESSPEETSVLIHFNGEIVRAVSSLQEKACSFYVARSTHSFPTRSLVPATYDDFMVKYIEVFQDYRKCFLDLWNKETSVFLQWLFRFRKAADLYVAERLVVFQAAKLEKMRKIYLKFESEKVAQLEEDKSLRENIKNKLLVVHGYNSNKNLLNELEHVAEFSCSELEQKISKLISKGRKYLKNVYGRYLSQAEDVCKKLQLFQDTSFTEGYSFSLLQQFKEQNSSFEHFNEPVHDTLNMESDLQYLLMEGIKDGNIPYVRDCLKNRQIALLTEIENSPTENISVTHFSSNEQFKKIYVPAPLNIQQVLSSMKQKYLNQFETYYLKMDILKDYKDFSIEWMKEWKSNIKSVQIPYCV